MTLADYFEAEQASDVKHEWFNGAVYAMSRGTPEHARLTVRIMREISTALPRGCEAYGSDMMLYIADAQLSTYADGSVVCGPLETITVKRNGKSLGEGVTNPIVIIEVLSDSTERYDREEKFAYCRTLPSLQAYVLVSQDDRMIEVYRRPASTVAPAPALARWDREVAGAGGSVTIHGRAIQVDAVYGAPG